MRLVPAILATLILACSLLESAVAAPVRAEPPSDTTVLGTTEPDEMASTGKPVQASADESVTPLPVEGEHSTENTVDGDEEGDVSDTWAGALGLVYREGEREPHRIELGSRVVYVLTLTLPEGVHEDVRLIETLPRCLLRLGVGLDAESFAGEIALKKSIPFPRGISTETLTIDLGTVTVTADDDPSNNTLELFVVAQGEWDPAAAGEADPSHRVALEVDGRVVAEARYEVNVVRPGPWIGMRAAGGLEDAEDSLTFEVTLANAGDGWLCDTSVLVEVPVGLEAVDPAADGLDNDRNGIVDDSAEQWFLVNGRMLSVPVSGCIRPGDSIALPFRATVGEALTVRRLVLQATLGAYHPRSRSDGIALDPASDKMDSNRDGVTDGPEDATVRLVLERGAEGLALRVAERADGPAEEGELGHRAEQARAGENTPSQEAPAQEQMTPPTTSEPDAGSSDPESSSLDDEVEQPEMSIANRETGRETPRTTDVAPVSLSSLRANSWLLWPPAILLAGLIWRRKASPRTAAGTQRISSRHGGSMPVLAVAGLVSALVQLEVRAGDTLTLKTLPEPLPVSPLLAVDVQDALTGFEQSTKALEAHAARFMEHYQLFILSIERAPGLSATAASEGEPTCSAELSNAYLGAWAAWRDYYRQARTARDFHRRLDAYHAAGYAEALTADLQYRLSRALERHAEIREEHSRLRSLVRYQLEREIALVGCEPQPQAETVKTQGDTGAGRSAGDLPLVGRDLPAQEGDASDGGMAQARGARDVRKDARPGDTSSQASAGGRPGAGAVVTGGQKFMWLWAPLDAAVLDGLPSGPEMPGPSGADDEEMDIEIEFSVDNRQCEQPLWLYLDRHYYGHVPARQNVSFSALEGHHIMCLARESEATLCVKDDQAISVELYQGFSVRPRC